MGKGDLRTRRGKIVNKSYGKTRQKDKKLKKLKSKSGSSE